MLDRFRSRGSIYQRSSSHQRQSRRRTRSVLKGLVLCSGVLQHLEIVGRSGSSSWNSGSGGELIPVPFEELIARLDADSGSSFRPFSARLFVRWRLLGSYASLDFDRDCPSSCESFAFIPYLSTSTDSHSLLFLRLEVPCKSRLSTGSESPSRR